MLRLIIFCASKISYLFLLIIEIKKLDIHRLITELLLAIVGIIWKAWHKKPIFLILINGGERRDNMIMSLVDTIWY